MASRQTFLPSRKLGRDCKSTCPCAETRLGVETREAIAVFCGIGLIVSLPFGDLPLDLSAGFF